MIYSSQVLDLIRLFRNVKWVCVPVNVKSLSILYVVHIHF